MMASRVPRVIHTYWSGPPPSLVARRCIDRMRELHPDWRVWVHDTDLESMPGLDGLDVRHRSDWVRICALARHGGVWLDATCYCGEPVTRTFDLELDRLQGFSAPFDDECLENWALAAPPCDPIVMAWKEAFARAIEQGFDAYRAHAPEYMRQSPLYGLMPYLTMHACYLQVAREMGERAVMRPSRSGPFEYLCKHDFNSHAAVLDLCRNGARGQPLVKLRGDEARVMESLLHVAPCKLWPRDAELRKMRATTRSLLAMCAMCIATLLLVGLAVSRARRARAVTPQCASFPTRHGARAGALGGRSA